MTGKENSSILQTPTANAATETTINTASRTIGMQDTGAPIIPLALGIISVLGGFAAARRK